ncbi:Ferrochelatase [compost metagenome]
MVVPIAFVSEHVETLVELDHEYGELAASVGCAPYLRAPAVGVEPAFIAALAKAVELALQTSGVAPQGASKGGPCAHLKACPGGCSKAA